MRVVRENCVTLFNSCHDKSIVPVKCSSGTYSISGQINCEDCQKGFTCPNEKLHSPLACSNGTYSNETRSVRCKICPAGFACPNPDQSPVECSSGYYSLGGTTKCLICPAGHR